jgi:uncharacterized protein YbbK (DUF523 family)
MKLRIGVSACLLGDPVRYDGQHKRSEAVAVALAAQVEWIRLCPEVEVGMGVPREPVHLVRSGPDTRMLGTTSNHDWSPAFDAWAAKALAALPSDLCGWVLKSGSPSCGRDGPEGNTEPRSRGHGLFVRALLRARPGLPLIEAEALEDSDALEGFLERARAMRQAR